jgi:hypothetical protein
MILGLYPHYSKHGCISSQSNIYLYFELAKIYIVSTNKSDLKVLRFQYPEWTAFYPVAVFSFLLFPPSPSLPLSLPSPGF